MLEDMYVRGTQVNYYFVCKTKLWLFSKNVSMEQESDLVKLGSLLQRQFFGREEKDVSIGPIAIDVLRRGDEIEIVEVKKSDSIEKADYYQVLYYIYYLSKFGIKAKGRISYPKKKKVVEVRLEENKAIEEVLEKIAETLSGEMPKPEYKSYCRKCAYFEFCFCG
ncbi:MAG: CRISPR-associated protein Cas4 [Archaeoglobales archaeon]|nr:CRISPR-associated protein Cas4 [Archaeoglobales archaeon]